jgi:hypothetical protein
VRSYSRPLLNSSLGQHFSQHKPLGSLDAARANVKRERERNVAKLFFDTWTAPGGYELWVLTDRLVKFANGVWHALTL